MIYVTGDTHGNFRDPRMNKIQKLPKQDKVIILGDFGFNWDRTTRAKYAEFNHECTILFLGGNHENYDYLDGLPTLRKYGARVRDFGNNTFMLENGRMYNIEGQKFFIYGGALSVDKEHRILGIDWWPQEIPKYLEFSRAEKTLKRNNYKFDYFLAHTAGTDVTDNMKSMFVTKIYDPVSSHLQAFEDDIIKNKGGYNHFYFGHWHQDAQQDPKHTCLYKKIINVRTGEIL